MMEFCTKLGLQGALQQQATIHISVQLRHRGLGRRACVMTLSAIYVIRGSRFLACLFMHWFQCYVGDFVSPT
jgi:hypothetical protein